MKTFEGESSKEEIDGLFVRLRSLNDIQDQVRYIKHWDRKEHMSHQD